MPELPEVQTVVDTLRPRLLGRRIESVSLARTDIVTPAGIDLPGLLSGQSIANIERRGKKIVFKLRGGQRFYIHLGMTGRLTVESPAQKREPHTHFIAFFNNAEMRFRDPRRFGGIWWLGSESPVDPNMGPEPLSMTAAQLAMRLQKTRRAVKNALLDQSLIAGLGNIYVDESLHAAKIHPQTPACDLSRAQVAKLTRAIKATLGRALKHRGSTLRDYRDADGKMGDFQKLHRVYHRFGQPCATCRTKIDRLVMGGRSTHFCPKCQKAPVESSLGARG